MADTTPIFAPDGTVRSIPSDQVAAALASGGKPAVQMYDPQGTARYVPQDVVPQAKAAGGKLVDPGFWSAMADKTAEIVKSQVHSWLTGGALTGEDTGPGKDLSKETFNPFHPIESSGYLVPQPIKDLVNDLRAGRAGTALGKALPLAATNIPINAAALPGMRASTPNAAEVPSYGETATEIQPTLTAMRPSVINQATGAPVAATPAELGARTRSVARAATTGATAAAGGALGHMTGIPGAGEAGAVGGAALGRWIGGKWFPEAAGETVQEAAGATPAVAEAAPVSPVPASEYFAAKRAGATPEQARAASGAAYEAAKRAVAAKIDEAISPADNPGLNAKAQFEVERHLQEEPPNIAAAAESAAKNAVRAKRAKPLTQEQADKVAEQIRDVWNQKFPAEQLELPTQHVGYEPIVPAEKAPAADKVTQAEKELTSKIGLETPTQLQQHFELPPDDGKFEYYYHAVRTPSEIDSILKTGIQPKQENGFVWLSKDALRERGAGGVIVKVPKGSVEESLDRVEPGLQYRQFSVKQIPPQDIVRTIRQVKLKDGAKISEPALVDAAAKGYVPTVEEISNLPQQYQSIFTQKLPVRPPTTEELAADKVTQSEMEAKYGTEAVSPKKHVWAGNEIVPNEDVARIYDAFDRKVPISEEGRKIWNELADERAIPELSKGEVISNAKIAAFKDAINEAARPKLTTTPISKAKTAPAPPKMGNSRDIESALAALPKNEQEPVSFGKWATFPGKAPIFDDNPVKVHADMIHDTWGENAKFDNAEVGLAGADEGNKRLVVVDNKGRGYRASNEVVNMLRDKMNIPKDWGVEHVDITNSKKLSEVFGVPVSAAEEWIPPERPASPVPGMSAEKAEAISAGRAAMKAVKQTRLSFAEQPRVPTAAEQGDLTPLLQKSLEQFKAARAEKAPAPVAAAAPEPVTPRGAGSNQFKVGDQVLSPNGHQFEITRDEGGKWIHVKPLGAAVEESFPIQRHGFTKVKK